VYEHLEISNGGQAALIQLPGQTTGLTVGTPYSILSNSEFTIDATASLLFSFAPNSAPGAWVMRWANRPWMGDRTTELMALHDTGCISWNLEDRVRLRDGGDGFTYVILGVPEPSTMWLALCFAWYAAPACRRRECCRPSPT
jgi:hypothetical protein